MYACACVHLDDAVEGGIQSSDIVTSTSERGEGIQETRRSEDGQERDLRQLCAVSSYEEQAAAEHSAGRSSTCMSVAVT